MLQDWAIILRHILLGTLSSLVVYFTLRIGTAIITAATTYRSLALALSFGAQPPTPEWG